VIVIAVWSKLAFWKKKEEDIGGYSLPGIKEKSLFDQETRMGMGFENPQAFEEKYPTAEPSTGTPMTSMPSGSSSMSSRPYQGTSMSSSMSGQMSSQSLQAASKDMEIISAKLDTIKANIDLLNKRLENLERIANS